MKNPSDSMQKDRRHDGRAAGSRTKNDESADFRFVRFDENKVNPQYTGALMTYEMTLRAALSPLPCHTRNCIAYRKPRAPNSEPFRDARRFFYLFVFGETLF